MSVMDTLKWLFGISGQNSARAKVIASIAEQSTEHSRRLNEQLRSYAEAANPIEAMLIDLNNKRAEAITSSREWHSHER